VFHHIKPVATSFGRFVLVIYAHVENDTISCSS